MFLNNVRKYDLRRNGKSIIKRLYNKIKNLEIFYRKKGNRRWIDVIDDLVHNYNNSYHSSIKMTPVQASNPQVEWLVYENLYGKEHVSRKVLASRFPISDKVRIAKWKHVFQK